MAKKRLLRDATDAERAVLRQLGNLRGAWTTDSIWRFSTDDDELAKTYEDLMQKRRELHPNAQTPPTLGEIFGLASQYLARSGRSPRFPHVGLSLSSELARDRCFWADASPLSLRLVDNDRRCDEPTAGDRLVLVSDAETSDRFAFLEERAVADAVKWSAPVGTEGILPTVLPCFSGLCFDLRQVDARLAEEPLARLFAPIPNARLLLVRGAQYPCVAATAVRYGMLATPIAHLSERDCTMFAYAEDDVVAVSTAWLRSLPVRRNLSFPSIPHREQEERNDRTAAVSSVGSGSAYLQAPSFGQELAVRDGFAVSAAVQTVTEDAFRAAIETALSPLAVLAAAGVDIATANLGIGLRLPSNPTEQTSHAAELFSLLLGLYRVQAEFACPAVLYAETDPRLLTPQLTVFAVAKAAEGRVTESLRVPDALRSACRCGGSVPNFADLRSRFRDLAAGGGSCRQSETAALGEKTHCAQTPAVRVPPMVGKYVWSKRYEITVLSSEGDASAAALAVALRGVGADCLNLSCAERSDPVAGAVSRRILTSRILILCPGATLPQDPHTVFALRLLSANQGLILRLDERAPQVVGFPSVTLAGSLPTDFLRQITLQAK